MLILIFGSKSGFGDDFGQSDTKTIILRCFLAKRLFEEVCFKTFVTWIIKLYNFLNICSRDTIESVVERFGIGKLSTNRKSRKF